MAELSVSLKQIKQVFDPPKIGEGDGATVTRIIGRQQLLSLDPFLMLDLFKVKLPAGFPDHPHRGFETVTYMLDGEVHHEDFKGHRGIVGPGDIQWMTAGKGIVHAEMPGSWEQDSYGFQLWINLTSKSKFCEPGYQEFSAKNIPQYKDNQMIAKVISGDVFGVKGPIVARTPTYFIDFQFAEKGAMYYHDIPAGWSSLVVCYQGSLKLQDSHDLNSVQAS